MLIQKLFLLVAFCTYINILLPAQDCLGELFVEPFENCNEDGTFNIDISFEAITGNDLGFDLLVNGELFDNYATYPEVFITVENIAFGEGQEIVITILDVQNPTCGSSYTFTAPLCDINECHIFDANLQTTLCENENIFVTIDFEFEGVSDQFILGGAGNGAVYNYGDIPFNIGPFEGNGETLVFEIVDLQNPECFEVVELQLPDCTQDCKLGNVLYSVSECDELGNLFIAFNVDHEGASEQFILGGAGNGAIYEYANLPIILNDIPGTGETLVFEIVDVENENCFTTFEVELLACETDLECSIYDVQLNPIACDGEGTYALSIVFQNDNTSENFNVYSDGTLIGTWAYTDLPMAIPNFPERPNLAYDIITICDSADETCCTTLEFMGLNCVDLCSVNELFAEPYEECNDDGTFNVDIEFEVTNGNESGFDVFVNGVYHSFFFSYPIDFVTIVLSLPPNEDVELMIVDNDNESCFATYTIVSPECAGNINAIEDYAGPEFDISYSKTTLLVQSDQFVATKINLAITNTLGATMRTSSFNENSFEMDLGHLRNGIYFVTLAFNNQIYSKKIVIP